MRRRTPGGEREALEAGADTFLPKPIGALRLLDDQRLAAKPDAGRKDAPVARRAKRSEPRQWSTPRR
jgi:hypothetical protein